VTTIPRQGLKQSVDFGIGGRATGDALHMREIPTAQKDHIIDDGAVIATTTAIAHRADIADVAGCGPVACCTISGAT
jgi:hypothetical protein